MTMYWVHTESTSALDALAAVERALEEDNHGQPPASAIPPAERGDPFLTENLTTLHEAWSVDQAAIVQSSRPRLARGVNAFQQLVRRATWWQTHPQWQQVSRFHAAAVRVIDVLLDRQRLLGIRIAELERAHVPAHVYALEQQIQALRSEQRELRQRLADLERQLAATGAPDQSSRAR